MKTFAFLYKLNINEKNDQNENILFSLCINKTYIYIGSTKGRIFIFKKKKLCLFEDIHYVNIIKLSTNKIITKICIIDKFNVLIIGTDNGNIFLIKNKRLIKGKEKEEEEEEEKKKKNIIKLNNHLHKNCITSIKYIIKDDSLYIFVGDIDGILSCFILKKNKNKIVQETSLLIIDKVNGAISHIEILQKLILVTCEKFNAIINFDEIIMKEKINFKNIGKKENNNYKSVFLNTKKKKVMILSLRKNGRIWLSNEEKVINTLVYYYSFFYFFYLFFFNSNNNNISFSYYKNYFLNNKYFINLLEIILTKFSNYNIPLKPNLNVCYKINNTFFILFEQTNPFMFLKNSCNTNKNLSESEKYEEDKYLKKLNLSNDIKHIKEFLKKILLEEENTENKKCISFIINNLNDAEEVLNKIKSKKIFLINIKNIKIEEILDMNVKYSYSLYKTSNSINNIKIHEILNEQDETIKKINDNNINYNYENYLSKKCSNEGDIEVNINKRSKDKINTSNMNNTNLNNNNNEFCVHNAKVNTTNKFNKRHKMSFKENMYEHYFKRDRIIDSFLSKNKLYLLYYNNNLNEDFYWTLNMNDNIFTSFNFSSRSNYKNKFNFYFCEIYLEENFELLKYLRYHIEKLKKLEKYSFYIFYMFVNIFHNYIKDRKKFYDINFFFFIEKNLITINENCYIENIEGILLRNIDVIKKNISNLLSYADKGINSLLIDKNYIYKNNFYDDKLFIIDFHYFNFNIKKIKKLYNIMKIIIIKYKYLFYKIIDNIVFSNIHNSNEQISYANKNEDETNIYKFIDFIENNYYILYNVLHYFYIFLYLEIIITNYTHRNNICLTNFPALFEKKKETIKEKEQLIFKDEKINENKGIYQKKKFYEKNRESTETIIYSNNYENNDYENIIKKLSNEINVNLNKNKKKNYTEICNKNKKNILCNIFIKNNKLYELYLLSLYNYMKNVNMYALNLKLKKKKKNQHKNFIFYKLFQHFKKKHFFFKLNSSISTFKNYELFLILYLSLSIYKKNKEYNYYRFYDKLSNYFKKKKESIKCMQINKNKKTDTFYIKGHLKKNSFLKKKFVFNINNEMEENKEKHIYNFEYLNRYYECMENISNIFYLNKYVKNIYNIEYKKKKDKINIHEFLNGSKNLYFYKKVLEGVYIININDYEQIYEYFMLYEAFFKIYRFQIILFILSRDYKMNNTTNNLVKSLFFNNYKNMEKNNISYVNIMTNKEIEFFEKFNKEVLNNNILLLDILLNTFNNIFTNSNIHLKFLIKKFSTFTYLNEYIDYIKQEEMREYNDNIILRKGKKFLYCCQNENYIKYRNYYIHCNLNNNLFTNYNSTCYVNSVNNNLIVTKPEKKYRNKYLKSKIKFMKKNNFTYFNGNNESMCKMSRKEKYVYIQYIKKKLNEYIFLNNKCNLKDRKNNAQIIFFKNLDLYNFLKIFYFLCKTKYIYHLYIKKKLERRRKVDKMSSHDNNQVMSMSKIFFRNKNRSIKISIYSKMKNKINILNYEHFYNLNKKRLSLYKGYMKYKYINNKFSICSKQIRIEKKKILKNIYYEWNSELCIQFLFYLKKNICNKFIRKKSLLILYQTFYVLILLRWKRALFLLLHIFRRKSHEIIFFLLLLIKFPYMQNYSSITLSEKNVILFYDKCIYILKNRLKFQNIIFPFLLQVSNNSHNFSFIILLIINFFFLEKSFFFKSILKSKKKMFDNYFLLHFFFFKKNIFLRKYIFSNDSFKSFHVNANFLFSGHSFIKSILKSCYKLLNFEESNYLIVLNNSIYTHFINLLFFFNINCFNFSHFHFFFFMLISSFYIGYFADFKYLLHFFDEAFSSISYKLQLINNQNEKHVNRENKMVFYHHEKNSDYINSIQKYIHLKNYEQKYKGSCYYNILNKKSGAYFLHTKEKVNPTLFYKNNNSEIIYKSILNKEKTNFYIGYNLNFIEDKNKKIDFEDDKILISINYLINFFYELLLKLLLEINLKLYNKQIELFILPNNRNTDLYIKINEFINTFYGTCILIYNKNSKEDNIYNSNNNVYKSNLDYYNKKNKIHIFLDIIDLFFNIYHNLLFIKMCFKKKRIVFINKKKHYKKYLLILIFVLFFSVTNKKGNKKSMLIFYKNNILNNNNFIIKRKIIKREKSLNILCCVLCIAHFINYFKYVKKNIKTKFLFIINYFLVNYNIFYMKQSNKKSTSSKNIHNIYKTIMKNLPKNIK
ncbi:conserved Plasmodium membrane protein, unknown function [Plasmodium gallinaceum]|uniref:Uncharacterized protein n=1 Tax=Plasmodium gallinaceum TaxID=5849 RepID=A0A1J1GMV0_PLAGA|nr:conserved Plasmodium membrane protein, unknown function [Plasmodium gallinaceum]CRG93776.1 conserved Plasmodium membrane protein, unknown function [Plasmodium gallinaceum]